MLAWLVQEAAQECPGSGLQERNLGWDIDAQVLPGARSQLYSAAAELGEEFLKQSQF